MLTKVRNAGVVPGLQVKSWVVYTVTELQMLALGWINIWQGFCPGISRSLGALLAPNPSWMHYDFKGETDCFGRVSQLRTSYFRLLESLFSNIYGVRKPPLHPTTPLYCLSHLLKFSFLTVASLSVELFSNIIFYQLIACYVLCS